MSPSKVAAPKSSAAGSSVKQFRALVDAFYEESFARFPEWGSSSGRHEFDSALSVPSPALFAKQGRLILKTLAAIEDLPLQDFTASDMLDRRAMLASLRMFRLNTIELERWRNNPQEHLHGAADAVYELVVRHADDLTPVAAAILARLKKIPRYLESAAACVSKPEPLWQSLAAKAAPGVAGMFRSLVEPLARATGAKPAPIARVAEAAAQAALAYGAAVAKLRAAPAGSFALGEPRMTLLIAERLGLNIAPREAAAMARRWAEQLQAELKTEARKFHAKKSAAEILDEAAAQWVPDGKDLLEAYTKETWRIRERFEAAGLVGFPKGDRLLIKPVPEFMQQQFPTAAYSSPGPLDPDQTGIFWVNDLSLAAKTEKQRRGEIAQHFGLELTCAHEAYPGHHLQFVIQNKLPQLARKMAHHAIYYEGWTLWCEQMTAELAPAASPYTRLQQLRDALWRAWRIVIDVGLQCGTLDYDAACKVLMKEVGFTRARAQGDVNWYTSSPTVPMSYLMGKMELLRLKRIKVDTGTMTLREFNDWLLSFGAIPWRWIEESGL